MALAPKLLHAGNSVEESATSTEKQLILSAVLQAMSEDIFLPNSKCPLPLSPPLSPARRYEHAMHGDTAAPYTWPSSPSSSSSSSSSSHMTYSKTAPPSVHSMSNLVKLGFLSSIFFRLPATSEHTRPDYSTPLLPPPLTPPPPPPTLHKEIGDVLKCVLVKFFYCTVVCVCVVCVGVCVCLCSCVCEQERGETETETEREMANSFWHPPCETNKRLKLIQEKSVGGTDTRRRT